MEAFDRTGHESPLIDIDPAEKVVTFSDIAVFSGIFNFLCLLCAILLVAVCISCSTCFGRLFNFLLLSLSISNILMLLVSIEKAIIHNSTEFGLSTCNTSTNCIISAAVTIFSTMSSFTWTLTIGVCCTFTLTNTLQSTTGIVKKQVIFSVLNWGGPAVIVLAAYARGALGKTDTKLTDVCWIRTCDTDMSIFEQILWMEFTVVLWEVLAYLTIANGIFVILCVRESLNRQQEFLWATTEETQLLTVTPPPDSQCTRGLHDYSNLQGSQDSLTLRQTADSRIRDKKLFLWIPVCLLLGRIWGTIRFILDARLLYHPEEADQLVDFNNVLRYCEVFGDGSQAPCNLALLLIFCGESRNWIKSQFFKLKTFFFGQEDNDETT